MDRKLLDLRLNPRLADAFRLGVRNIHETPPYKVMMMMTIPRRYPWTRQRRFISTGVAIFEFMPQTSCRLGTVAISDNRSSCAPNACTRGQMNRGSNP